MLTRFEVIPITDGVLRDNLARVHTVEAPESEIHEKTCMEATGQAAWASYVNEGSVLLEIEGETYVLHYDRLYLDLADPTARAHAAWAWKKLWADGFMDRKVAPRDFGHVRVLARMASGDETVTIDEARAALRWAESIVGGP